MTRSAARLSDNAVAFYTFHIRPCVSELRNDVLFAIFNNKKFSSDRSCWGSRSNLSRVLLLVEFTLNGRNHCRTTKAIEGIE